MSKYNISYSLSVLSLIVDQQKAFKTNCLSNDMAPVSYRGHLERGPEGAQVRWAGRLEGLCQIESLAGARVY